MEEELDNYKEEKIFLYPKVANPVFIQDEELKKIIEPELDEYIENLKRELNGEKNNYGKNFFCVPDKKTQDFNFLKNLFGKAYTHSGLEKELNSNGSEKIRNKIRVLYEPLGENHGIVKLRKSNKEIDFGLYTTVK